MTEAKKPKTNIEGIEINEDLCKGCDICIEFCPTNVFEKSNRLNRKGYYLPVVARVEDCNGCRLCDLLCPDFAIVITDGHKPHEAKAKVNDDD